MKSWIPSKAFEALSAFFRLDSASKLLGSTQSQHEAENLAEMAENAIGIQRLDCFAT